MWMLDTDTCSYILRAQPRSVTERLKQIPTSQVAISSVVLGELYYGADLLPSRTILRNRIGEFIAGITLRPWDAAAADHYGTIRAELKKTGLQIGAMDMMIAAHALSLDAVLVTNNIKHFGRVPRLKLENWI